MKKSLISFAALAFLSFCLPGSKISAQESIPVIKAVQSASNESDSKLSNPNAAPMVRAAEFKTVPADHNPGTVQVQVTQDVDREKENPSTSQPMIVVANQFKTVPNQQPPVQNAVAWNQKGQTGNATVQNAWSPRSNEGLPMVRLATGNRPMAHSNSGPLSSPLGPLSLSPKSNDDPAVTSRAQPVQSPFPRVARLPNTELPPIVNSPKFEDQSAPPTSQVQPYRPKGPLTNRGIRPKQNRSIDPYARRSSGGPVPLNSNQPTNHSPVPSYGTPTQSHIPIVSKNEAIVAAPTFNETMPNIVQPGKIARPSESEMPLPQPETIKSRQVGEVVVEETGDVVQADGDQDRDSTRPRRGLFSRQAQSSSKTKLASWFDGDPIELGKDVPRFSGVSEFTQDGEPVLGSDLVSGCSCGNCQSGTCNSPRCQYDLNSVNDAFNHCGYIARARKIYKAEGLYWFLESDPVVGSTFGGLENYEGSLGGRFTYIDKQGVRGREFIYSGFESWNSGTTVTNAFPIIDANLVSPIFPFFLTAPFFNATSQTQTGKARLHTFEANRTWWGWDVVKTDIGIRYIYLSDDYRLSSFRPGFGTGDYFIDTENHMIGPQVGMEIFYDVGKRFAFEFSGKIGGGVNFHKGGIAAANNGAFFLNNSDDATDWMWNFDIGASAHWKLGPCSRLVAGYDVLGMFEVSNPHSNFNGLLLPTSGASMLNESDVFAHGFSFGIEIFR